MECYHFCEQSSFLCEEFGLIQLLREGFMQSVEAQMEQRGRERNR